MKEDGMVVNSKLGKQHKYKVADEEVAGFADVIIEKEDFLLLILVQFLRDLPARKCFPPTKVDPPINLLLLYLCLCFLGLMDG